MALNFTQVENRLSRRGRYRSKSYRRAISIRLNQLGCHTGLDHNLPTSSERGNADIGGEENTERRAALLSSNGVIRASY